MFARAARNLRMGLESSRARFDFIREVRGEGLIIGIDLSIEGAPFVAEALRQGLLINCTHDHIIRLLPPFIITQRDVAEFLRKFETVLARVAKVREKSAKKSSAGRRRRKIGIHIAAARSGCGEIEHEHDCRRNHLALKRDLLTGTEWSPAQLRDFFHLASRDQSASRSLPDRAGRQLFVLIFEKPSLRTRVTFETGIASTWAAHPHFSTIPPRSSASASRSATSPRTSNAGCRESSRVFSRRKRSKSSPRTRMFRSSTRFPTNFIPARRSRIFSRSRSVSATCAV